MSKPETVVLNTSKDKESDVLVGAVMPCTSARALHVQMCSEFTALGHVQWKKIEFFFWSLFVPLLPLSVTLPSWGQNYFFFPSKKSKPSWKKHSEEHCENIEMSSSWPEDYYTPVAEMDTNHILKSMLTGESRQQKGDSRTCLFCGFSYFFRSIRARYHLVLGSVSKKVQKCKPPAELWAPCWSFQGSEKEGRAREDGFLKNVGCSNESIRM